MFGFNQELTKFFSQGTLQKWTENTLQVIMRELYNIVEREALNPQMIRKTFNS